MAEKAAEMVFRQIRIIGVPNPWREPPGRKRIILLCLFYKNINIIEIIILHFKIIS